MEEEYERRLNEMFDLEAIPPRKFEFEALKIIIFPKDCKITKINKYAFGFCQNLKKVEISPSVEEICKGSFIGCKKLDTFTFPHGSNLKIIGSEAFLYTKISSFAFPSTLRSIGDRAFYGAKLNIANLSQTCVDNLQSNVFSHFDGLIIHLPRKCKTAYFSVSVSLKIHQQSEYIKLDANKALVSIPANSIIFIYRNRKRYIIREGISRIFDNAMSSSMLRCIHIPPSVTEIGSKAFYFCMFLKRVTFDIDSKLKIIKMSAFRECTEIRHIHFPRSLQKIEFLAFGYCSSLKRITFPKDSMLESIDYNCFYNTALENLILPASLMEINGNLFNGLNDLKRLKILSSRFQTRDELIIRDNSETVSCCSEQEEFWIPEGIKVIKKDSFDSCHFKIVHIPASVEVIKEHGFSNNSNLEHVIFEDNSNLVELAQQFIGMNSKVNDLKIPPSIKKIDLNAFSNLSSLKKLEIQNDMFKTDEKGVVYALNPHGIVFCPPEISNDFEIRGNVVEIYGGAFNKRQSEVICLSASIKKIGEYSFNHIGKLIFDPSAQIEQISSWAVSKIIHQIYLPKNIRGLHFMSINCDELYIPKSYEFVDLRNLSKCRISTIKLYDPDNME